MVDEIADSGQEIISYLNNESQEIQGLNGEAAEIIGVYAKAIEKVDEFGNAKASQKVRKVLQEKVELIATKDYGKIKKEFFR